MNGASPADANDAVTPRSVNTSPNPATYASAWRKAVQRDGGAPSAEAATATVAQGAILLLAYTIGLGLPFLGIALVYDRAPGLLRPLVRHGRAVSIVGGGLVVAIGLAMLFNWLALLPQWFQFNTAI